MSPKNVIKMINIQKYYSVHVGSIWSIMSSLVQFGPIQSIMPTRVEFSLFSLIQSTLTLFGPI